MGKSTKQGYPYEIIFAGLPQAMLLIDSHGIIRECNARCEMLTGYSAATFDGTMLTRHLEAAQQTTFQQRFDAIIAGESAECTCDVTIIGKPVTMTLWPIQEEPLLLGVLLHERLPDSLAEALQDSAAALNSTLDLDEVLDRILDNVRRVVDYEAADIMILDGEVFRVAGSRGYEPYGIAEWISDFKIDAAQYPVWQRKI